MIQIPIRQCTRSKVESAEEKSAKFAHQLQVHKSKTPTDLWLDDLVPHLVGPLFMLQDDVKAALEVPAIVLDRRVELCRNVRPR